MQRSRCGDCGQFTALFVAWCRAVDIPARPVIGTFIDGFKPHVWAEFWLDKVGWVPVDPSYGQALSMDDGTETAARVFGRIEPTRWRSPTTTICEHRGTESRCVGCCWDG